MRARVPRYLHLPVQILWFDMEDISIIIVCYVFWMITDSWYVLPLVVLAPYTFMKIKESKPRGFLRHTLYQYGFQKLEGYPSPATRKFHE